MIKSEAEIEYMRRSVKALITLLNGLSQRRKRG